MGLTNNKQAPFVIVVGMHRSGTTMLAKLLHINGVHMGFFRDPNFESRMYGWDVMNFQNFLGGTWECPLGSVRDLDSSNYFLARERIPRPVEPAS